MPCVCLSFLKLAALPKDPSSRSNMKSRQFQSSSNGVWTLYIIWENLWECYLALLGTSVLPLLTFSDCSHESYVKNKTPQQRGHGVGWGWGEQQAKACLILNPKSILQTFHSWLCCTWAGTEHTGVRTITCLKGPYSLTGEMEISNWLQCNNIPTVEA